jgi:hypothetical protein
MRALDDLTSNFSQAQLLFGEDTKFPGDLKAGYESFYHPSNTDWKQVAACCAFNLTGDLKWILLLPPVLEVAVMVLADRDADGTNNFEYLD